MEKLKSYIPNTLKRMIAESTPDDLPSTCSSLLEFFVNTDQFHKTIGELANPETTLCGKSKDAALESKQKGNECFLSGDYTKALSFYSQALRVAPIDSDDKGKNLVATLCMNRASSLHKMGLLVECLRDCNRALLISPSYAKAWYRRGKINGALENFEDAIRDLNVAMNMEKSLGGKRQIQSELGSILDKHRSTSSSTDQHNAKSCVVDEPRQIKLQCVFTATKGRGMASLGDIPQASLVHTEEPYAAIILKHCRETHCHFCFNELPADTVPCTLCSIPLYCSQHCKIRAGGQALRNFPQNNSIHENVSDDLEHYVAQITLANNSDSNVECFTEHKHECQGVHWAAVLPSEIVLAGRVLVKSIEQRRHSVDFSNLLGTLELVHSYVQMLPEFKLELHVYSIVLLYCLRQSYGFEFPINGVSISQLVILIAQIKVNSMAITRMKFIDLDGPLDHCKKLSPALTGGALTSNVEQVKVGQAIYLAGSLFNHSCQPNIHVYFLSRTLCIRSTQFVAAGCPLEFSYGPQVGQWYCKDRQQFLQDEYSFRCQCSACSELNLSDLVLNAFRCVSPNCFGIVLDKDVLEYEKEKINHFQGGSKICVSEHHMQVDKLRNDDIIKVARHAFERTSGSLHFEPGYCLNCGSYRDLSSSHETVNKNRVYIRRLQDELVSGRISSTTLSDAIRSLGFLRLTLHAYNKGIAEVEDNLAQAYCFVGEFQSAMEHCKASIKILEKLYDPSHIVIGYELVKLSSIQLVLGDSSAVDNINRLSAIFSRYYGSHTDLISPCLQTLKREASRLVH